MIIVASLFQIIDSSRDLQPICAKYFVNRFYLILYAYVQIFDVIFLNINFINLYRALNKSRIHAVALAWCQCA